MVDSGREIWGDRGRSSLPIGNSPMAKLLRRGHYSNRTQIPRSRKKRFTSPTVCWPK